MTPVWKIPKTWRPGDVARNITATVLNREIRDQLLYLYDTLTGGTPATWVAVAGGIGFLNSWTNVGSPSDAAAYIKEGEWVSVRGAVTGGVTGDPIFTLPSGFQPPNNMHFPVYANNATGFVTVYGVSSGGTAGDVVKTFGSSTHVDLSTLRFRVT